MVKHTESGWVHALSKEALVTELAARKLPTEGTRDELRARLVDFIRSPVEDKDTMNEEGSAEEDQGTAKSELTRTAASKGSLTDTCSLLDTARKWGCQFDGKDGIAFLERLEDLRESYGLTHGQLRKCLPLFFKDQALLWYRNNKDEWDSWEDFAECFRQYYIPSKTKFQIEEAIARRTQEPNETARDYVTAIQTLMRRHGAMTPEDRLERTYYNLRPEYRLYVRRTDFRDLAGMLRLADEYERTRQDERAYQNPKSARDQPMTKMNAAAISPGYNPQDCCWGCGQRGHIRRFCRRPPKVFCSRCGKEGVLTRDCHGTQSGNGPLAGDAPGAPRPIEGDATKAGSPV